MKTVTTRPSGLKTQLEKAREPHQHNHQKGRTAKTKNKWRPTSTSPHLVTESFTELILQG